MRYLYDDTIVALATAAGEAGLAVVRLSGRQAISIAARLFDGADLAASESHRAHHGWIVTPDGERLDEVLALVLRAPRSYTGEDTVELSCHGSPQVVDELVELLRPLVRHPGAIGLEVTIYDPALDPDRSSAARLADLLEAVLADDALSGQSPVAAGEILSRGRT